jgi:hypothetical protein
VLRVCVRNGFSRDLAGMLVDDLRHVTERLESHGKIGATEEQRASFHH